MIMITVKSKRELENAIKAGHKEIYVSDKKLQAACYLASKYQGFKSVMSSITTTIMGKKVTCGAISDGTLIVVTLYICITAIAIVAIIKKCKVKINYNDGTITVE